MHVHEQAPIPFRPLQRQEGYLPIEDHGLIGDGSTCALVGRDGAVSWLCLPRFDSEPLFCALLDDGRGGRFKVAPVDAREARQRYLDDTAVLQTEIAGPSGVLRITDAMALAAGADLREDVPHGRAELVRVVEALKGPISLAIEVEPRGPARAEPRGGGWRIACGRLPGIDVHLAASRPLERLCTTLELRPGERLWFVLRWGESVKTRSEADPGERLDQTAAAWRRWMSAIRYDGPQRRLVHRSALALKLLHHSRNGAIIAAPTSSLPEAIGGPRNWDYRYAWIRDAALPLMRCAA